MDVYSTTVHIWISITSHYIFRLFLVLVLQPACHKSSVTWVTRSIPVQSGRRFGALPAIGAVLFALRVKHTAKTSEHSQTAEHGTGLPVSSLTSKICLTGEETPMVPLVHASLASSRAFFMGFYFVVSKTLQNKHVICEWKVNRKIFHVVVRENWCLFYTQQEPMWSTRRPHVIKRLPGAFLSNMLINHTMCSSCLETHRAC